MLAGVAGLTKAFQTLSAQDFAEAKVRSLGTNSDELVARLKQVSKELGGQASVAELTGAAYDVASAGFTKASDAAMVLKAASLGATGGFSDINTVGNAATSVLNAYGLAASDAGLLVDRFIQTQNDGKIVVAEYAQNIGKVAAAAAGLNIPLEQVNAAISQSTASGVQAEIAFTGLKSAFARLASGDANKELEDFGIKIDAASISSDGLVGTLKKLEGLDTGTLFKVLGTEAGPALLPIIQNLERFEELIEKQKNSAGAAAAAQKEAANTIQGAWKAVSTEFENLFSEQSAFGDVIKVTLFAAAGAVKVFAATVNLLLDPFKKIIEVVGQIAGAVDKAFDISGTIERANSAVQSFQDELGTIRDEFLSDLAGAFEPIVELWGQAMDAISGWWGSTTQTMGEMADGLGGWIQGVWNGIASGAQNIISPIVNAFKAAFDGAWNIIMGFYNSLPGWLKGALSAAGSVAGGVANAVTSALNKVGAAVDKGIAAAGKAGQGKAGPGQLNYKPPAVSTVTGGGGGGGGKGGSKGGGKGGGATRESQVPQLTAELALKQKLFQLETQMRTAQLAGDKIGEDAFQRKIIEAQLDGKIAALQLKKLPAQEKGLQVELARLEAKGKLSELDFGAAKAEADRQKTLEDLLVGFDREIELAGAKTEEAKKLLEIEHKILDLRKDGLLTTDDEIQKYRDRAQAAAAAAAGGGQGKLQAYMDQLQTDLADTEGRIVSLAGTIEGEIGGAMSSAIQGVISGTTTVKEAFSQMFKNIGAAFIDMATQMIAKALIMKVLGIFGGGGSPFSFSGDSSLSSGFSGTGSAVGGWSFAGGGYTGDGARSGGVDGEGGFPAILHPQETVVDHSRLRSGMSGERGSGASPITLNVTATRIGDSEFVKVGDLQAAMRQTRKEAAADGEKRTLAKLQQSPSTRRRVGI